MKIEHNEAMPNNGCLERHETVADVVQREYDRRGFRTRRNVDFNDEHFQGDIDVYACKPGYLVINEIKSTDGERQYLKGLQQLAKAYTHAEIYKPQERILTAYAAADPKTDDVHLNWIPRRDIPNKYTRQLPEHMRGLVE
jgi:hypothetical protein